MNDGIQDSWQGMLTKQLFSWGRRVLKQDIQLVAYDMIERKAVFEEIRADDSTQIKPVWVSCTLFNPNGLYQWLGIQPKPPSSRKPTKTKDKGPRGPVEIQDGDGVPPNSRQVQLVAKEVPSDSSTKDVGPDSEDTDMIDADEDKMESCHESSPQIDSRSPRSAIGKLDDTGAHAVIHSIKAQYPNWPVPSAQTLNELMADRELLDALVPYVAVDLVECTQEQMVEAKAVPSQKLAASMIIWSRENLDIDLGLVIWNGESVYSSSFKRFAFKNPPTTYLYLCYDHSRKWLPMRKTDGSWEVEVFGQWSLLEVRTYSSSFVI